MRHRVYGKHLGRDKNQRNALFKNLVQSLILHGKITTTDAKAKAIRGVVDKIINQAKTKETRRFLQTFLQSKYVREKLVNEVAPGLASRNSGYTSLVKLGQRKGDGAMMVRMSLLVEEKKSEQKNVQQEDKKPKQESSDKNKAIRRRVTIAKKLNS